MKSDIYIDPKIDMYSDANIEVIIEFNIKPAKAAVATSLSDMSIEQAKQQVEASHQNFDNELEHLEKHHIKYELLYTYKDSFNGVSMRLQANDVKYLLQSAVIKAIYKNEKVELPKKPGDTMYQI